MKNTLATLLTFAAAFACGSLKADDADIFDVHACDQFGKAKARHFG